MYISLSVYILTNMLKHIRVSLSVAMTNLEVRKDQKETFLIKPNKNQEKQKQNNEKIHKSYHTDKIFS